MKTLLLMLVGLIAGCQFTFESKPSRPAAEPALSVISDEDLATYNRVRRLLEDKAERNPPRPRSHEQQPNETYDQWYRRVGPIIPAGD